MNLNPALRTERACVPGAPGAARGNARRVEIFSGDSIPPLLRLASEAQSRSNPGLTGVNGSKNSKKFEEKHEKQNPADLLIFSAETPPNRTQLR
jgi:hypothetical protein